MSDWIAFLNPLVTTLGDKLVTFSQHTAESRASFEMSRPGVLGEHPRAYLPWNAKENEALTQLHRQGVSVAEIAEFVGRNHGAIDSQLRKLGLEENQN